MDDPDPRESKTPGDSGIQPSGSSSSPSVGNFKDNLKAAFANFRPQDWSAAQLCALFGLLGILSGFAVFILLWEKQEHPWRFMIALVPAAGGFSFFVEWARKAMSGEHEERDASWSWSRVIVLSTVAATFELFIIAITTFVEEVDGEQLRQMASVVLGAKLAAEPNVFWELTAFMSVWLVAGAAMSAAFSRILRLVPNESPSKIDQKESPVKIQEFAWPTAAGAVIGGIVAPVCSLAGVLLTRAVRNIVWSIGDPPAWYENVLMLSKPDPRYFNNDTFVMTVTCLPIRLLALLGTYSRWIPLLIVVGLGVAVVWSHRTQRLKSRRILSVISLWLLVGCAVTIFAPLLNQASLALPWVMAIAAVVWLLPASVLGASVPIIKKSANSPKHWGFVSFAAAVVLLTITLLRTADQWNWFLGITCVIVIGTGFWFRRGSSLAEYWPLAAVSIAILVSGANVLLSATFRGAFVAFHSADNMSLAVPDPARRPELDEAISELERLNERNMPNGPWSSNSSDEPALKLFRHSATEILASADKRRKSIQQYKSPDNSLAKLDDWLKGARTRKEALDEGILKERWEHVDKLWREAAGNLCDSDTLLQQIDSSVGSIKSERQIDADTETSPTPSDQDKAVLAHALEELRLAEDKHMRKLARLKQSIEDRKAEIIKIRDVPPEADKTHIEHVPWLEAKLQVTQNSVARMLELCITGAYGFWVTAGLLMAANTVSGSKPD